MVSSAQPTSGSSSRLRNFWAISAVYPARIRPHSRIEPSRADHIVATLNSAGVRVEPFSATNPTEKSRVMRARSMATVASSAPARAMKA